jgi:ABC-type branched-subunit amino acid transport system ATPase component
MSEPALALEVNGVAKNFGGVVALREVTFSVREGEVMGLIGPNGAGKSTLFEIVSGNVRPSAGRVSYFGRDCTNMASHLRRRAGMCRTFQKVRLFESMTVRQNISVAASQCLPRGGDLGAEVAAILAQLRLEAQAERRPSELTLADRKRVEIGRAIAGHCRLLMLDESLSGLTHDEAEHLIDEILTLNRVRGITVIVVEHVLSVLAAMVKRLVVLHNATVIADGTPTEVAHDRVVIEAYLGTKQKALR